MPSKWSIGWHVRRGAKGGAAIGALLVAVVLLAHYSQLAAGIDKAGAGMGTGILVWIASLPFGLAIIYAVATYAPAMPASLESSEAVLLVFVCICVVSNWMALGAGFGLLRAWLTKEIAPPGT